ncbi:uncharacterized protein LOC106636213 [Copidosoma floridanum]|uniref:uncharacterized protein LOC106636213 n=1 Tax=Copidosoma floridanum TaxID=29053 RepID=UPI0006C949D5|nr:uncharacterized protein LOC106636213 [Copidosoma floridanum]
MVSIVPKKCGTHLITIMFEKYEKALAGFWILMGGDEEFCYQILFKFIKLLFPYFNPKVAVVDYDQNIQNGLKNALPNIDIIPSFLHQIQSIFENAIRTHAAVKFNRTKNAEKHVVLQKFMALSLLPRDYILSSFNRLMTECKSKHGTYFDSFIDYYTKEWLNVWTPEALSIYRFKHFMKNFLECYQYRLNFKIGKELSPHLFIEKIKNVLVKTRLDLYLLEKGEVLSYYLVPQDEERERKMYKTWDRLDRDFITMNEALVICSNLLNEDFIDSLPDSVIENKNAISESNVYSAASETLRAEPIFKKQNTSVLKSTEERMVQD